MEIVLVNPAGEASYQGDKSTQMEQYMYPYSVIYLLNYLAKKDINRYRELIKELGLRR